MNRHILIGLVVTSFIMGSQAGITQQSDSKNLTPVTLAVSGMTCQGCAASVRSAIAKVPSVKDPSINLAAKRASFRVDPDRTTLQEIIRAVRSCGKEYDAKMILQLDNPKTPAEVIKKVRHALLGIKGVNYVSEPDRQGVIMVGFDDKHSTKVSDLMKSIQSSGVKTKELKA